MPISIPNGIANIVPITDVRTSTSTVLKTAEESGPILIQKNSGTAGVFLSVADYESLQRKADGNPAPEPAPEPEPEPVTVDVSNKSEALDALRFLGAPVEDEDIPVSEIFRHGKDHGIIITKYADS